MARLVGGWAVTLAVAYVPVAAVAQPAAEISGLSWIVGSWRGAGTMFGRPSEAVLEIRPALGGRFLEFSYRAGGFEGRAFYAPAAGGRWQARWFDNRGVSFAIEARAGDRTLTADWGSDGSERGRTVYRLADDGRLQVGDFVLRDGDLRPFASHNLSRANGD